MLSSESKKFLNQKKMRYTVENKNGYSILTIDNQKLDTKISADLKAEFVALHGEAVKNMIVDLSNVKYTDSSGLSALLVGNRTFTDAGGSFVLSGVSEHVMKLIRISKLDQVLMIFPTLEQAISALPK